MNLDDVNRSCMCADFLFLLSHQVPGIPNKQ